MITLVELCEKLKTIDEVTLMEKLDISSEDLVSRFIDVIENRYEELSEEFSEETDE